MVDNRDASLSWTHHERLYQRNNINSNKQCSIACLYWRKLTTFKHKMHICSWIAGCWDIIYMLPKRGGNSEACLRTSFLALSQWFTYFYLYIGTWIFLQSIETKQWNARSWQMKITETKRGRLKHACPINCPPKTCLNCGASGKVNPRNISTYKIKQKITIIISKISELTVNHYNSLLVSLTCKSWDANRELPNALLYFFLWVI
jgi:hypothetical protein